ncbi:HNH endonuclease signature motif containing protein [Ilumatobacter nonamiensis]|uniref:HNH endonuclease signature motif containing protein n=1 Tax=Ilumatobacter nonamiensis TaxID=467093 RepID=UPI00058C2328|nr:HNH endonuclease signature motif containing protein [Ilumatobacter nonamiensis]
MDTGFVDELVAMPTAALDELLRAAELERRDAEVKLALIASVAEQRQQFLSDGHRSMAGYLKAHLNCSGAEANRIRRRGKLLNEKEGAIEALAAGRVSMSNADVLAKAIAHPRVGDRVGEFVPTLLEHAEHFPPKDFGVLVDRVIANADADGAHPDDDHGACATVTAGPDGVYINVTGGTALQGAEMKAIFDLAVEAEFRRDVEARRIEHGEAADQRPLPRSARQRRFAAQYAIHMAYVSTPADAQRPEPIVNILYTAGRAGSALAEHGLAADDHVFDAPENGLAVEDADDLLAGRCETSTGVTIGDHAATAAMIRGRVRRAVIDTAGVTIDLGPRRRLFVGAAREAAQLIALRCSHPGCSIPAEFCDVDHLRRHADGGPTDQHNAGPGCGSHNRFKERAGLRSRRAANGRIYLIRPDGSVVLPVGERRPDWAEPDPRLDPRLDRQPDRPPDRAPPGPEPPGFESITWGEFMERRDELTRVAGGGAGHQNAVWSIVRLGVGDLPLTG